MRSLRPPLVVVAMLLLAAWFGATRGASDPGSMEPDASATDIAQQPALLEAGARAVAGEEPASPTPTTRLRVISAAPGPEQVAVLQRAGGDALGPERRLEPGVWAMVEPGAWIARLEGQDGARAQRTVHVPEGAALSVELLASHGAVVRGTLLDRGGNPPGPLEVWFLPPGVDHPASLAASAPLQRTRATFEGAFESPELEPGEWRISVGPVGAQLCVAERARQLLPGLHEVEVHLERGSRADLRVAPIDPERGLMGHRFQLQRRIHRGGLSEADDRAWRRIATLSSHRFQEGLATWPTIPEGRYRLLLDRDGVRYASQGFDVESCVDLALSATLPAPEPTRLRMRPSDPSLPLDLSVVPTAEGSAWTEGVVWL